MNLTPASSIIFLLFVLALVGCGVYLRWSKTEARHQPRPFPGLLSGREAVARHLYGEYVAWDPKLMQAFDHDFDTNPAIRAIWLAIADNRLRSQECTRLPNTPDPTRSTSSGTSTGEAA